MNKKINKSFKRLLNQFKRIKKECCTEQNELHQNAIKKKIGGLIWITSLK
jgi:DNA-binding protein YbaB